MSTRAQRKEAHERYDSMGLRFLGFVGDWSPKKARKEQRKEYRRSR